MLQAISSFIKIISIILGIVIGVVMRASVLDWDWGNAIVWGISFGALGGAITGYLSTLVVDIIRDALIALDKRTQIRLDEIEKRVGATRRDG